MRATSPGMSSARSVPGLRCQGVGHLNPLRMSKDEAEGSIVSSGISQRNAGAWRSVPTA